MALGICYHRFLGGGCLLAVTVLAPPLQGYLAHNKQSQTLVPPHGRGHMLLPSRSFFSHYRGASLIKRAPPP